MGSSPEILSICFKRTGARPLRHTLCLTSLVNSSAHSPSTAMHPFTEKVLKSFRRCLKTNSPYEEIDETPLDQSCDSEFEEESEPTPKQQQRSQPWTMVRPPRVPSRLLKPVIADQPPLPPKPSKENGVYKSTWKPSPTREEIVRTPTPTQCDQVSSTSS